MLRVDEALIIPRNITRVGLHVRQVIFLRIEIAYAQEESRYS
jgi:hypothetical protein